MDTNEEETTDITTDDNSTVPTALEDDTSNQHEHSQTNITQDTNEPVTTNTNTLSIQVGSFSIEENAGNLKQMLETQSFNVRLKRVSSGFTRVIITKISSIDLEKTKQILTGLGITDVIVREENNS